MNSPNSQIKELLKQGFSYSKIQAQLNVSPSTIARIKQELEYENKLKSISPTQPSSDSSSDSSDPSSSASNSTTSSTMSSASSERENVKIEKEIPQTILNKSSKEEQKIRNVIDLKIREKELSHELRLKQLEYDEKNRQRKHEKELLSLQIKKAQMSLEQNNKVSIPKSPAKIKFPLHEQVIPFLKKMIDDLINYNNSKMSIRDLNVLLTNITTFHNPFLEWIIKNNLNSSDYVEMELFSGINEIISNVIKKYNKSPNKVMPKLSFPNELLIKMKRYIGKNS